MKSGEIRLSNSSAVRAGLFVLGAAILVAVFIFQRYNPLAAIDNVPPNVIFAVNRTIRLIFNDLACLLIILSIFREKKYVTLAFYVFLVELLVILPLYLVIKLSLEGDSEISSPLLSQVHRLIVNPMLMILLMAGFLYQRFFRK